MKATTEERTSNWVCVCRGVYEYPRGHIHRTRWTDRHHQAEAAGIRLAMRHHPDWTETDAREVVSVEYLR